MSDPLDAVRQLRAATDGATDRGKAADAIAAAVLSGLGELDRRQPDRLARVLRRSWLGHPELADLRADVVAVAEAVVLLERGGRS